MKKGNKNKPSSSKHGEENGGGGGYFAVSHRKRRKQILKFGVPVIVAAIAFGLFVTIQAQEQGIGADIIYHIHPNLTLILDGNPIPVPKNIGIDSPIYKDHSLDRYSMAGMAPIHTHDSSGIIHVESTVNRNYTFSEFLNIWGMDLSDKTVQITGNSKPVNNLDYILKDGENIIMEIKQQ